MMVDLDEWREAQEERDILSVLSQGQGLSCGVLILSQRACSENTLGDGP